MKKNEDRAFIVYTRSYLTESRVKQQLEEQKSETESAKPYAIAIGDPAIMDEDCLQEHPTLTAGQLYNLNNNIKGNGDEWFKHKYFKDRNEFFIRQMMQLVHF